MKVWEYKVEGWKGDKNLKKRGKQGWELCGVDGELMFFKRPVQTEIVIPAGTWDRQKIEAFERHWLRLSRVFRVPHEEIPGVMAAIQTEIEAMGDGERWIHPDEKQALEEYGEELQRAIDEVHGEHFFGKDWKDRDEPPDGAQRLLGSL